MRRACAVYARCTNLAAFADILIFALPALLLPLLAGLGLIFHVLATEGRTRSSGWSQILGLINLGLLLPLGLLVWLAEGREQRWMFMFVAGAFALVGLLGLRVPRRFRD